MTVLAVDQLDRKAQVVEFVRVASRTISLRWGSIRFRLALRTYAPWGCIVRNEKKTDTALVPGQFMNVTVRDTDDSTNGQAKRAASSSRGHFFL